MLTADFRAAIADPTEDGDRARPAHAVAWHRGQRRRVQPRQRAVPPAVRIPGSGAPRLHQRDRAEWNLEVVGINYPDFHTWREGAKLFEGLAIWDGDAFNLSTSTGAERIRGARVTHDLAKSPRDPSDPRPRLLPEEDTPKGPPVVLITEVWRERFGGRGRRRPDPEARWHRADDRRRHAA